MLTCNSKPVIELRLTLPISGVWVAELEVDSDVVLAGPVTITDGTATYKGTVVRSGVKIGSCYVEAVGGAGGIARTVAARSFIGVSARAVLVDTLGLVSERLDPSSTAASLSTTLTYWTRSQGRAGAAIATLAESLASVWRVLPSGAVWLGKETWPTMPKSYDALEVNEEPAAGTVELAPETIALVPGVTLGSRRVGRVEHRVARNRPLRTIFWAVT